MEPTLNSEKLYRPSYVSSTELSPRSGPVSVEDLKTDLSSEFSLVSSSSDTSQRSSLDSKGHIQVCLRIRPFTSLERENGSQDCVSLENSTNIILKPHHHYLNRLSEKTAGQMIQKFTFSQVFGPETTQEEFFEGTIREPVQDFLDGYNRLVFTYGVTNAGKTYTFQGTEDDVGILPRALDLLFKSIQGKLYTVMDFKPHRCRDYIKLTENQVREEVAIKNSLLRLIKEILIKIGFLLDFIVQSMLTCNTLYLADLEDISKDSEQSTTTARNYIKFSVWVSFFEIYNECFYDLLIPISNDKKRKTLRLAQDIKGCSFVKGLQWVQISDSKEAFKLLKLGLKHQSIASTKLNNCSSRSHSIFTVKLLKIEDLGAPRVTRVNELSFCDLAGSERYTKTRNEGDRLKESGNINTSLLTLGKCITALKNCQQSKLQQHIPFRESKLTHFLQGFFSGKGKVYMIVNISQCASAYDETLNVLKFSAIAQKVLVMDTSILPQDQSFDQKLAGESSLLNVTKMPIPRKRATILWDRTLEDVLEDDDGDMEEQHSMSGEEVMQENEENKVIVGKEEYMVCARVTLKISVVLVEELKNKLITEKKNKLLLELKIREEVIQEFTQYSAEREIDFKECLVHERTRLEENAEKRLEIFKELVNGCPEKADEKNKLQDQPGKCSTRPDTCIDFESIIGSLQNDIADIKHQAEAAHQYIASLEDPQETIGWLEKQLEKITAELIETKEQLTEKTKALKSDAVLTQDNTRTALETKLAEKSSNEVIESSHFKETVLELGRKRCFENKPTAEEEPPTKKGTISTVTQQGRGSWENSLDLKRSNNSETYAEIVALKERTETLEGQIAALEEQCQREKNKKEELSWEIRSLHLKLSASEERASGLSEELQRCQADYQEIVSKLDKQKTINREQEEKIIQLNNQVTAAEQNIIDKVSQIKTMQSQADELYKCHLESYAMDTDSVHLKDSLDPQKDESETAQVSLVSMQFQTASAADLGQESSFHRSIETIWEECKIMIKASSQKSHRIQEQLQQLEDLNKRLHDSENCNNQLKIKLNEIANQDHQSIKEKDMVNQLQEKILKKTQDFEKQAAEDQRVIAQFQEKVTGYEGKIRDLECLLEAFRTKDDSIKKLEEALKEKESIISNLQSNMLGLHEKCTSSEKKMKELNDEEANLKDEVVQLTNSLEIVKHSLQEKEKNEDEQIQTIELLRKDLSESSALVESLKKDLQRKEEEYTDLKEKFSDAKKQIQQVREEVCTMQSEDKTLRKKVTELEKIKNQFSEELEFKQRTILKLQKEQSKLEEISKQYEKTHKDLRAKEKIIEDMRMTLKEQEQTQIEQDQVLEAKLEEINRLVLELEACKEKYRELDNQSNSDWQQKMSKNEGKAIKDNEELIKLQKELKENEAKYQTDRKKWLEEKVELINQVKEAETHHNREMRKFVEDREHHVKQQAEIDRLAAQLVEKDSNLQKWREERDELVEALEIQLKNLASSTTQKDKEIEELKQAALKASEKELKQHINHEGPQSLAEAPLPEGQDKIDHYFKNCFLKISIYFQDHSEIVLDSSEVSTEDGKTSRFPKPEMEIQFTPLQPNKMEVKHQGSTSPVTVKMLKPKRKRKSVDMNEDFVKSENKRNAKSAMADSPSTSNKKMMSTTQSLRKEFPLRKQESSLSKKSDKKKDGTLQKIGDFFQSSPTIIHSKAKKLIETISSPKSAEPENVREKELKPKRAKRKLYSADISAPLEIPVSSVFVDQKEKESDHLIIKRRLRSRIPK
ncbi:KI20B protein, partial [Campylorhamphus procurvoides]|nr:KI20B protein [Campylorhamphus procurvoides]